MAGNRCVVTRGDTEPWEASSSGGCSFMGLKEPLRTQSRAADETNGTPAHYASASLWRGHGSATQEPLGLGRWKGYHGGVTVMSLESQCQSPSRAEPVLSLPWWPVFRVSLGAAVPVPSSAEPRWHQRCGSGSRWPKVRGLCRFNPSLTMTNIVQGGTAHRGLHD